MPGGRGGGMTPKKLTADDFSEDVAKTLYPQSVASYIEGK